MLQGDEDVEGLAHAAVDKLLRGAHGSSTTAHRNPDLSGDSIAPLFVLRRERTPRLAVPAWCVCLPRPCVAAVALATFSPRDIGKDRESTDSNGPWRRAVCRRHCTESCFFSHYINLSPPVLYVMPLVVDEETYNESSLQDT